MPERADRRMDRRTGGAAPSFMGRPPMNGATLRAAAVVAVVLGIPACWGVAYADPRADAKQTSDTPRSPPVHIKSPTTRTIPPPDRRTGSKKRVRNGRFRRRIRPGRPAFSRFFECANASPSAEANRHLRRDRIQRHQTNLFHPQDLHRPTRQASRHNFMAPKMHGCTFLPDFPKPPTRKVYPSLLPGQERFSEILGESRVLPEIPGLKSGPADKGATFQP